MLGRFLPATLHSIGEVKAWGAGKEHNNDHAAKQHRTTHRKKQLPDEPTEQPATRGAAPRIWKAIGQVVAVVRAPATIEFPGGLVPLPGSRGSHRGALHPL